MQQAVVTKRFCVQFPVVLKRGDVIMTAIPATVQCTFYRDHNTFPQEDEQFRLVKKAGSKTILCEKQLSDYYAIHEIVDAAEAGHVLTNDAPKLFDFFQIEIVDFPDNIPIEGNSLGVALALAIIGCDRIPWGASIDAVKSYICTGDVTPKGAVEPIGDFMYKAKLAVDRNLILIAPKVNGEEDGPSLCSCGIPNGPAKNWIASVAQSLRVNSEVMLPAPPRIMFVSTVREALSAVECLEKRLCQQNKLR